MHHDSFDSLRSFSREKHLHNQWHSHMPVTVNVLKPLINFLSFKHAGVSRLAQLCRPGHIVIDLGSGDGTYSRYFASQCKSTVCAVDWSPEALQKIKHTAHPSIKVVCADGHALPFKDNTIHGMFTIDFYGHLQDQPQVLYEIQRVLKNGSPLFFHSECSDYQTRWPDRSLIAKNKKDIPAELDGHISLHESSNIIADLKKVFRVVRAFSPAGHAGWILGYPEKYVVAFQRAGMWLPFLMSRITSTVKTVLPGRAALRLVNAIFDRVELALGITGGGSVFADLIQAPVRLHEQPSIDIIIPSFKRHNDLFSLCELLLPQCRLNDAILVVSQDPERPHLPQSERIQVLFSSPPNLPRARNRGIVASSNDIILFLDDDVTPDKDLLEHHRKLYSDKNIHCTAGSIRDYRFEQKTVSPSTFDIECGTCKQNFSFPSDCKSISFMGAHFSLRRSTLKSTSIFDPEFKGNAYWEDIDFAFRLLKAGIPITFSTKPVVTHKFSPTGGSRSATTISYISDYFANTTYFAFKYMPIHCLAGWFHYWKYRLEFQSRTTFQKPCRHNPLLLAAGCFGFVRGIFRFLAKGKRMGLPEQVIQHWYSIQDGISK